MNHAQNLNAVQAAGSLPPPAGSNGVGLNPQEYAQLLALQNRQKQALISQQQKPHPIPPLKQYALSQKAFVPAAKKFTPEQIAYRNQQPDPNPPRSKHSRRNPRNARSRSRPRARKRRRTKSPSPEKTVDSDTTPLKIRKVQPLPLTDAEKVLAQELKDLQTQLHLPEKREQKVQETSQSKLLQRELDEIPGLNLKVVAERLWGLQLTNQEDTELRRGAADSLDKELSRKVLSYLTQKALLAAKTRETDTKATINRLRAHAPKKGKYDRIPILRPTDKQNSAQMKAVALKSYLGTHAQAPVEHPFQAHDYSDVLFQQHVEKSGYATVQERARAHQKMRHYDKHKTSRKMRPPTKWPDAEERGETHMRESYAQLTKSDQADEIKRLFAEVYSHQTNITERCLKKLAQFKTPATPCQPMVATAATYLPHLYKAWKDLTLNTMAYSSSLPEGPGLLKHQIKLSQDTHANVYFLKILENMYKALQPEQLTFDNSWSHLMTAQKMEHEYPWQGKNDETDLQNTLLEYNLSPKISKDTKKKALNRLIKSMGSNMDGSTDTTISPDFFSKVGPPTEAPKKKTW